MANTSPITVRANKKVKEKAQEYFESLGISMSAAINMFLNDVVTNRSLSFSISNEPYWTLYRLDESELDTSEINELRRVEELSEDNFHTITVENYEYFQD